MRRRLILLAVLLTAGFTVFAQSKVRSSLVWDLDRVSAGIVGDSVEVAITFLLIDDSVERSAYVSLTPVLRWVDREFRLTPLSVCGLDMKSPPRSGIATMTGRPQRMIEIRSRIPYDVTMNHFSIAVTLSEFRGGKEYRGELRQVAVFSRTPRPEPELKPYMVEPPKMTSDERRAVIPLSIGYKSSEDAALDLDDRENFAAFDTFLASCSKIVNDERTKIVSMEMSYYTPVKGDAAENKRIASARLRNVVTCLIRQKVFGKRKIATGTAGEDWKGVQEWTGRSFWSDDHTLRGIVSGSDAADRKEERLRAEYPEAWAAMCSTLFPYMERMECVITYTVQDMADLKDLQDAYRTDPGFLEPRDFYRLLSAYEPHSYGWNEVFLKCAETWPQSQHANINAAAVLLSLGKVHEAGTYLRRCGDSGDARYMRAVQMYALGNISAAEELLRDLPDSNEVFFQAKKVFEERRRWEESEAPWSVQIYGFGKNWL